MRGLLLFGFGGLRISSAGNAKKVRWWWLPMWDMRVLLSFHSQLGSLRMYVCADSVPCLLYCTVLYYSILSPALENMALFTPFAM